MMNIIQKIINPMPMILLHIDLAKLLLLTVALATKSLLSLLPLLLLLSLLSKLSYYFATDHVAADNLSPGVVELTTQLLIPSNILWVPLCRIYKFGLNTLPSKTVAIPYTCGLSELRGGHEAGGRALGGWRAPTLVGTSLLS